MIHCVRMQCYQAAFSMKDMKAPAKQDRLYITYQDECSSCFKVKGI